MKRWINKGSSQLPVKIKQIERCYCAKYVCDLCILTDAGWSEQPVQIYYVKTPSEPHFPHYFGVFVKNGVAVLTCAASAAGVKMFAVEAEDGEIIFSRYRHDYRQSKDGTAFIDGGRDYSRYGGGTPLNLILVDGTLRIIGDDDVLENVDVR